MWNHNHYVASLSEIGRWLAEKAEEVGVTLVPDDGQDAAPQRRPGRRDPNRRQGARQGGGASGFEPGSDIRARVTILAEGTRGHLAGVASERFGLASGPQVYALGVKEVWEVPKPLNRVVHTMGWPLRAGKRYRSSAAASSTRSRTTRSPSAWSSGSTTPTRRSRSRPAPGAEAPVRPQHPRGGHAGGVGSEDDPRGGFRALPGAVLVSGGMVVGDSAGFVNVPALKGVHYAMKSGLLAAEAAVDAVGPGATPWAPGALDAYDQAVRESYVWKDLKRVRNMRPAFKHGFYRGALLAGSR